MRMYSGADRAQTNHDADPFAIAMTSSNLKGPQLHCRDSAGPASVLSPLDPVNIRCKAAFDPGGGMFLE